MHGEVSRPRARRRGTPVTGPRISRVSRGWLSRERTLRPERPGRGSTRLQPGRPTPASMPVHAARRPRRAAPGARWPASRRTAPETRPTSRRRPRPARREPPPAPTTTGAQSEAPATSPSAVPKSRRVSSPHCRSGGSESCVDVSWGFSAPRVNCSAPVYSTVVQVRASVDVVPSNACRREDRGRLLMGRLGRRPSHETSCCHSAASTRMQQSTRRRSRGNVRLCSSGHENHARKVAVRP